MLNKQNKIQKKKEVENVFKNGKSSFDKILGVKVLKTENKITRFVIVVSTKISKKAVVRNRLKRQLSEVARLNLIKLKPGTEFFIIAMPEIAQLNYHDIEKVFLNHCKKLRVLAGKK